MEEGHRRGYRRIVGTVLSLSKILEEHPDAIGYDLLTRTGKDIKDLGGSLSWRALYSFIQKIDYKSETLKEMSDESKELSRWDSALKTNLILADIYDMLANINSNLVAIGSKSRAKKIKPYPRPFGKEKDTDTQHFGSDGLPPDELARWFEERRRKHD